MEVNKRGNLIRQFGTTRREHLNVPRHLAVCADGKVMVADCYNRRVLLLDPQLNLDRVLIQRAEGVLPWRLCKLERDGRYLVAETWLYASVKVFGIC